MNHYRSGRKIIGLMSCQFQMPYERTQSGSGKEEIEAGNSGVEIKTDIEYKSKADDEYPIYQGQVVGFKKKPFQNYQNPENRNKHQYCQCNNNRTLSAASILRQNNLHDSGSVGFIF